MKKIFFIGLLLLSGFTSMSQFSRANLQATGLTCALCSNAINKALLKLPFVESVNANIKNSSFAITFRAGSAVSPDVLKNAVENAGFSIGSLQLTGNFNHVMTAADQHLTIGNDRYHIINGSASELNGETTFTIVDKNFVTPKNYKKVIGMTNAECFKTGKTAACCVKDGMTAGERIYHVTI
jgi:copper chaperone CopZ